MKKFKVLLTLLMISANVIIAQKRPALLNPAIRYGVLENGMTYYILHNEEPKERASFYIVHNVGAILEEDSQNGLAHMLEHMAFNGSKNFKGKGIKNFLERQGVEFGSNINAYTELDETVYNISNVPTATSGVMDSCVLILHDWSGSLTLEGNEIDAERSIIKEEWRTRNNARTRMEKALSPTRFYQSKYAKRDIIGDMEVIEKSPYNAIRSFYQKWYRPDLQAVIIVGDFDEEEMEARVKRILSTIPASVNASERLEYPVGDNNGIIYDFATDKEAQYVNFSIMTKHPVVKREEKNTAYLRNELLATLYWYIVNERLENIEQKPKAPFTNAYVGYFNVVRTTDAYGMVGTKPDHSSVLEAMEALMLENERVKRYGITPTELERAKIKALKFYEQRFKNRKEMNNDRLAMSLKNHYLVGDPKPGIEFQFEFVKKELPTITEQEVGLLAKKWNKKDNVVVTIQGPKNVAFEYPTQDQIEGLFVKVQTAAITAFVDQVVTAPLVANEPRAGKIVSSEKVKGLAATAYTLSNGSRVVVYPTDKNDNQILFNAYSKGGTSLLGIEDLPTAGSTTQIAGQSGIGEHSLEDLKKLLLDKQVSFTTRIGSYNEELRGSTTPEDIETLMKLIYLAFEAPRFEKEAFDIFIEQMKLQLKNASTNPRKLFGDSITAALVGGDLKRRPLQNLELVDKIAFEKCEKIYKDRISNAGDFVFAFVGAINADTLLPLVEKYIGSIPDNGRRENWKDNGVRPYANGYEKIFSKKMETAKQMSFIRYWGEGKYTMEKDIVLSIANAILNQRYFETIREQEGGSYGVSVYGGFTKAPYEKYSMSMYFDANPDKADKLVGIIHREVATLLAKGPSEDDYKKAIETLVNKREQSLEQNGTLINGIMNLYSIGYNTVLPENYEDILDKMTPSKFTKLFNEIMKNSNQLAIIMKPELN